MLYRRGNIVRYNNRFGILESVKYNSTGESVTEIDIRFFDKLKEYWPDNISLPETQGKLILILEGNDEIANQAAAYSSLQTSINRYKSGDKSDYTVDTIYKYLKIPYHSNKEMAVIYDRLLNLIINYLDFDMVSLYIDKHISEDQLSLKNRAKDLIEQISGSKVM